MIWGRLFKGDSQEFLKRYSIVDLGFQFRIGVDVEPLLEKQTFQEEKRGIGVISFVAFADGVISDQDAIDARPIDNGIDFLHSFDRAITFERVEKSDVGKGEVGIDFFEAHSSSIVMDLKEQWHKREL
jgi:hypothetical protein